MVISMLKIRRPLGRLIFNMGIAIPGKTVFLIETAPSLTIVYSTVYSGVYRIKHQQSASLAFVRGMWPVNSPHKVPVTRKMFPFDDDIMFLCMFTSPMVEQWSMCLRHGPCCVYLSFTEIYRYNILPSISVLDFSRDISIYPCTERTFQ